MCSLLSSCLVLLLFCGIAIADINTRKIAFNDYSSIIDFNIENGTKHYFGIKVLGKIFTVNISFIYDVINFFNNAADKIKEVCNLF